MLTRGTRPLVRAIAILAAVKFIATLLFVSEEESTYIDYIDNFDHDFVRQLSPIIDPELVRSNREGEASSKEPSPFVASLYEGDDNNSNSGVEKLVICNRPTNVPLVEPPANVQKYSTCAPITKSKPILILEGSKGYGRTGNRLIEFLKTVQHSRDHGVQVGIVHGSWVTNEITRMWMAQAEYPMGGTEELQEWGERFEREFCVKIFLGNRETRGWTKINKKPRDLFKFKSRLPIPEYAQSQEYTIRTLFRHYNTGAGYASDRKPVRDMCSVIDAIFPTTAASDGDNNNEEEGGDATTSDATTDYPSSSDRVVYSVIHSRSMSKEGGSGVSAGETLLRGVSNHAGCDPIAALEMRPDYIKSILRPLGMLRHPIVFISDGQDSLVLERLRDDPELGPLIRTIPPNNYGVTPSWIGGDITLGVMSDVFIGNPASTFATFIAKARLALGFENNYLFRAKDEDGNWKTVCGDGCLFDHGVLNVMA
eukprot:CAMPEP_0181112936 /NCGR_PEP_ID=MMETSP1071-20121207/20075_1 /TAXON_ID=35127 /ORGANISM="Thalassiosira sp., Strain NH16" /LENGTH=480 /DNA_ID=CAMNT_0023196931 /DNA_START=60 /DNA_END=1502 /DNA_ORIENTATION=-